MKKILITGAMIVGSGIFAGCGSSSKSETTTPTTAHVVETTTVPIATYTIETTEPIATTVERTAEPTTDVEVKTPKNSSSDDTTYILNTNTHKFHYPSCSSVEKIKESNKDTYTGDRDYLISSGYSPCKKCNP